MSGFHGNQVLQRTVDALIAHTGVTSFVETGTHYADTTLYMAVGHPTLPIFTCEIDDHYYLTSLGKLQPRQNVRLSKESSEKFIDRLIAENVLGDLPMFFLDAHWYDYWPLPDEVASIAKLPRFIILVDDFAVPGQPQFETSAGGGGTIGEHRTKSDDRPCSMALISSVLPQDCQAFYPKYSKSEAFGTVSYFDSRHHLVGYVLITKGILSIEAIKSDPLHFRGEIR